MSERVQANVRAAAPATVELEIDGVVVKIVRGADAGVIAADTPIPFWTRIE